MADYDEWLFIQVRKNTSIRIEVKRQNCTLMKVIRRSFLLRVFCSSAPLVKRWSDEDIYIFNSTLAYVLQS